MDHLEFRAALDALGVSQHQLARDIEMDVTTVNRWATGKAEIPGVAAAYVRSRLRAGSPDGLPEQDVELLMQAYGYLGGFMGPPSSYQRVEELRARIAQRLGWRLDNG
jgi:transcriptional regulator with XRE-family HTH domain